MAAKILDSKVNETVIAANVQVKGNLVCQNDLWFDGVISGDINCEGSVTIGPSAQVAGNINCANLVVAGQVRGRLTVKDSLGLSETADVKGDIRTGQLAVGKGAYYSGQVSMGQGRTDEDTTSNQDQS